MGLITDIQEPNYETRVAILKKKAEADGFDLPDNVCHFIAKHVQKNVRELEGALNRIVAYASMGAMPISIELAQAVLSNVLYTPKKRQVTPERIAKAVSEQLEIATVFIREWRYLEGERRDQFIAERRRYEERIRALFREGVEDGELRVDLDPSERMRMMQITGRRTVPQRVSAEPRMSIPSGRRARSRSR